MMDYNMTSFQKFQAVCEYVALAILVVFLPLMLITVGLFIAFSGDMSLIAPNLAVAGVAGVAGIALLSFSKKSNARR